MELMVSLSALSTMVSVAGTTVSVAPNLIAASMFSSIMRAETKGRTASCVTMTVSSSRPDRSRLYQGQTPQAFKAKKLKELYESLTDDEKSILTDACKIFSMKGFPVRLIQGEVHNIKITYPYDLRVAKALLDEEIAD